MAINLQPHCAHKSMWCGLVSHFLKLSPRWTNDSSRFKVLKVAIAVFETRTYFFWFFTYYFFLSQQGNEPMMTENNEMESELQLQRSPSSMSTQPVAAKASIHIYVLYNHNCDENHPNTYSVELYTANVLPLLEANVDLYCRFNKNISNKW